MFNDLQPVLDSYWTNIEQTAMEVIDNFQMSSDDFKKDQLKLSLPQKLTEKIKGEHRGKSADNLRADTEQHKLRCFL